MEYDQRMEELDKLEYPKPLRDFVYETFNAFADRHPWVGEENIRPKSIAREMFEQFRSFAEYVLDYELQRSEGLLLRHLNSAYKVLSQTVPDAAKTDGVRDIEVYLQTMLRDVDSTLEEEWARMRDPNYRPLSAAGSVRSVGPSGPTIVEPVDITRDAKSFTMAIRTRVFTFLRAWSIGQHAAALESLDDDDSRRADLQVPPWTTDRLRELMDQYGIDHGPLRLDPEARNLRHTHVAPSDDGRAWKVDQVLVDPDGLNDWQAEFEVDLAASRRHGAPALRLLRLGEIT
jgi:hypothetical protein